MSLHDVARLVCPRAPDVAIKLLNCFYNKKSITREEILSETGYSQKLFEYYLTRFRRFRLIRGERTPDGYRYILSPDGFHTRLDTLYADSVKNLART